MADPFKILSDSQRQTAGLFDNINRTIDSIGAAKQATLEQSFRLHQSAVRMEMADRQLNLQERKFNFDMGMSNRRLAVDEGNLLLRNAEDVARVRGEDFKIKSKLAENSLKALEDRAKLHAIQTRDVSVLDNLGQEKARIMKELKNEFGNYEDVSRLLKESESRVTQGAAGSFTPVTDGGEETVKRTFYSTFANGDKTTTYARDPWTNKGLSSTGKNLAPGVAASHHPAGTVIKDLDTGAYSVVVDTNERTAKTGRPLFDIYTGADYPKFAPQTGQARTQVVGRVPVPKTATGANQLITKLNGGVNPYTSKSAFDTFQKQQTSKPKALFDSGPNPPRDLGLFGNPELNIEFDEEPGSQIPVEDTERNTLFPADEPPEEDVIDRFNSSRVELQSDAVAKHALENFANFRSAIESEQNSAAPKKLVPSSLQEAFEMEGNFNKYFEGDQAKALISDLRREPVYEPYRQSALKTLFAIDDASVTFTDSDNIKKLRSDYLEWGGNVPEFDTFLLQVNQRNQLAASLEKDRADLLEYAKDIESPNNPALTEINRLKGDRVREHVKTYDRLQEELGAKIGITFGTEQEAEASDGAVTVDPLKQQIADVLSGNLKKYNEIDSISEAFADEENEEPSPELRRDATVDSILADVDPEGTTIEAFNLDDQQKANLINKATGSSRLLGDDDPIATEIKSVLSGFLTDKAPEFYEENPQEAKKLFNSIDKSDETEKELIGYLLKNNSSIKAEKGKGKNRYKPYLDAFLSQAKKDDSGEAFNFLKATKDTAKALKEMGYTTRTQDLTTSEMQVLSAKLRAGF